jgi:restriction system protein
VTHLTLRQRRALSALTSPLRGGVGGSLQQRRLLPLAYSHVGRVFVALGGFTRAAEDAARRQERRKITLIDLNRLVELWVEFYAKLDDLARERLPLTPIYFLTPKE